MIESIVALLIAIIGVSSFSIIVLAGHKTEIQLEEKTDRILAKKIMKENGLKKIVIHDYTYERN